MRLWHKDLIKVLPRKQLLSQYRECIAIISKINKVGNPQHALVNKIMDFPANHFYSYTYMVAKEMKARGYKVKDESWNKFVSLFIDAFGSHLEYIYVSDDIYVSDEELYFSWHNKRYFWQCYYNLEEKYDCGLITQEEWNKIRKYLGETVNV